MGLKECIPQPQGGTQHEQNEPGDQEIDQPALARGFWPVVMI
jgi:hypothetical protein